MIIDLQSKYFTELEVIYVQDQKTVNVARLFGELKFVFAIIPFFTSVHEGECPSQLREGLVANWHLQQL